MLQKIKNLMQIREEIDKINEKLSNTTEAANSLKNDINALKEQLNSYISKINEKNSEFFRNFEEELQKELQLKLGNLNKDAEEYNELKGQIANISLKVNNLSEEISKFLSISKNIKERDFEMTHFARQLIDMDREKLELMRKIDTLERLVGRMRRTV